MFFPKRRKKLNCPFFLISSFFFCIKNISVPPAFTKMKEAYLSRGAASNKVLQDMTIIELRYLPQARNHKNKLHCSGLLLNSFAWNTRLSSISFFVNRKIIFFLFFSPFLEDNVRLFFCICEKKFCFI